MIKRSALLMVCILLSLCLCSCAIEPISNSGMTIAPQPSQTDSDGSYVLADTEDVGITVTSVLPGEDKGEWLISVQYENRTDRTLDIICEYIVVNGWQAYDSWFVTLEPGGTAAETMELNEVSMNSMIMESPDRLTFFFEVTDANDWYADPLLSDNFTIYPTGLTDDQIVVPERPKRDGERVIVDDENVEFVIVEINEDTHIGAKIVCCAENRTDEPANFTWENTTVNNWSINPYFFRTVAPNSRSYLYIYLSQDSLDLCGISQIDKLEFQLLAGSSTDFTKEFYVDEFFCEYPTGLTDADIPSPERAPIEGEQVLADTEALTVIVDPLCFGEGGVYMNFYVRNRTGVPLDVDISDFVINDSADAFNYVFEQIPVGSSLYCPVFFAEYSYSSAVGAVESIRCSMTITDRELFETVFDEVVSATF